MITTEKVSNFVEVMKRMEARCLTISDWDDNGKVEVDDGDDRWWITESELAETLGGK